MYYLWLKYLFTILHSIGVYDSSGITFSYTATRPENIAGILTVGSTVNYQLLIPPNANNFTVSALCSADCTQRVCEWWYASIVVPLGKDMAYVVKMIVPLIFLTSAHSSYWFQDLWQLFSHPPRRYDYVVSVCCWGNICHSANFLYYYWYIYIYWQGHIFQFCQSFKMSGPKNIRSYVEVRY